MDKIKLTMDKSKLRKVLRRRAQSVNPLRHQLIDPLRLKVAKALCAAGHHEWPEDNGIHDYNNAAEVRYWLKLADAAIQAIGTQTDGTE